MENLENLLAIISSLYNVIGILLIIFGAIQMLKEKAGEDFGNSVLVILGISYIVIGHLIVKTPRDLYPLMIIALISHNCIGIKISTERAFKD